MPNVDKLHRSIFIADNLNIMRGLDSDSVDLIATDPPFNKGKVSYKGTKRDVQFKDVWSWDNDVQSQWWDSIQDEEKGNDGLSSAIQSANLVAGKDMGAYLCWMAIRVIEMHRILKPTGSIYLHCDPTASHYLKMMMDCIFGRENFRNEIIWGYRGGGVPKTAFARKHDVILFYTKSDAATFNPQYTDYSEATQKLVKSRGGVSIDNKVRDLDRGATLPDWWGDINSLQTWSPERTGYPTQKPLALYKRIIAASSNPGDMVLDPFAGSATTCVAAERLGRRWIGIDTQPQSRDVLIERLKEDGNMLPTGNILMEDNLPALRRLKSDCIDLIATDPPFNKGVGTYEGKTREGESVEFKDVWSWENDVLPEWETSISKEHPNLVLPIQAANAIAGKDMGAYLCWMAIRIIEMHRVLKPTGSMYLHCDPTASHYLKTIMDAIFGRENFRNEIIWGYSGGGIPSRDFPRKHDVILRYTKSKEWVFNVERKPYKANTQAVGKHSTLSGGKDIDLELGTPVTDCWTDIQTVTGWSPERTGYPTQKPLALYKRIIAAASNPGDVVLDPFAGSATTCVAAEQLGREWIGIDNNMDARTLIHERLEMDMFRQGRLGQ